MVDDEDIEFANDENDSELKESDNWKVMIVDDDKEVHVVTKLVLSKLTFKNKGLNLISAYSGKEAKHLIVQHPDTAFILLDVVMETPHAGLNLVKFIREEINNHTVRIILRTGQPGQAPEKDVIDQYDINDYKDKTELTALKLYSLLYTTLRSYNDIKTIQEQKVGLEKLIESSKEIFQPQGLKRFSSKILQKITELLGLAEDSVYLKLANFVAHRETKDPAKLKILAANGTYSSFDKIIPIDNLPSPLVEQVAETLTKKENIYCECYIFIYFCSETSGEHVLCLRNDNNIILTDWGKHLLNVYCSNITIALENVYLRQDIENTQTEIIYSLSDAVESRSRGKSYHIKRIGLMSEFIANQYGCDNTAMIRLASATHDLGKVAIPDNILNKPGKLNNNEWEIMKTHASLGYEILKDSNKNIIKLAATIALEHHERWDGEGYPYGLKGDDICIEGRIIAVADVFDALTNDRCYKASWKMEDIIEYFKGQRGKQFDPNIVDILLNNIDVFIKIKNKYKNGTDNMSDDISDYLCNLQI